MITRINTMTSATMEVLALAQSESEVRTAVIVTNQLKDAVDFVTVTDTDDVRPAVMMTITKAALGDDLFDSLYGDAVGLEGFFGSVVSSSIELVRRVVVGIFTAFKNFILKILEWIGIRDSNFESGVNNSTKSKAKRAKKDIANNVKDNGKGQHTDKLLDRAAAATKRTAKLDGRKDHPVIINANKEVGIVELDSVVMKSEKDIEKHNKAYDKRAKYPDLRLGKLTSLASFDVLCDSASIEIEQSTSRIQNLSRLVDGLNRNKAPSKYDELVDVVDTFITSNAKLFSTHYSITKTKSSWLGLGISNFTPRRGKTTDAKIHQHSLKWSPQNVKKGANALGFTMDVDNKRKFYEDVVPRFEIIKRELTGVASRIVDVSESRNMLDSEAVVAMLMTTAEVKRSADDQDGVDAANRVKSVVSDVLPMIEAERMYLESITKVFNDFVRASLDIPFKI